MKIFKDLPTLVQALPELALSDWVDLPADAAAQLDAPHQSPSADLLTQPALRFVARDANEVPRMGYVPWMPVAVLAQMHWPSPSDAVAWSCFLQAEFGRSQRFVENHDVWDEADLPEPHWLPADASLDQRLAHWYQGLQAHAWMDEEPAQVKPFSRAELRLCEWRLGCALPQSLRDYLLQLGVLDWAERLLSPRFDLMAPDADMDAIGSVQVVFPGIADIVEMSASQQALALEAQLSELVVFGDYLGNGNLWCFDRCDGSVWYLDHDSSPLLTRMFDDVGDYLDALALMSLCRSHAMAQGRDDGDEQAEVLLEKRFGRALIRKWMY
ncbi:SMI1/KNR4 family protein [Comamonas thiooxydans]|uniref:SMI1/KNR4 family protein n=1 Tax=Comamonas thiooxydans TaxID=363952 RepID=UPI00242E245B|nr:SMI1/KNR4 family protein [Comamonas thiooxydans]MDH1255191.1 SMI1/KNR4 family protein [Comamonas thiooxydans]